MRHALDLIAIGAAIIVFAFLIARALARTVFTERRPKLPSQNAYGDGLTMSDIKIRNDLSNAHYVQRIHNGGV